VDSNGLFTFIFGPICCTLITYLAHWPPGNYYKDHECKSPHNSHTDNVHCFFPSFVDSFLVKEVYQTKGDILMTSENEALILEQLEAINRRLESIEARLDRRLIHGQETPAPPGSFLARRQACIDQLHKKGVK
jgi:hypothetical protein